MARCVQFFFCNLDRYDAAFLAQKIILFLSLFAEIGVYDIRTMIDHILNKTKQKKLSYVGHSQGTTSFLVLTSMLPSYNDKIVDAHLLAPVANLNNTRNQVNAVFAKFYTPLSAVFNTFGIYKLTISNSMVSKIFEFACKGSQKSTPFTCKLGLAILGSTQINCVSFFNIFLIDD